MLLPHRHVFGFWAPKLWIWWHGINDKQCKPFIQSWTGTFFSRIPLTVSVFFIRYLHAVGGSKFIRESRPSPQSNRYHFGCCPDDNRGGMGVAEPVAGSAERAPLKLRDAGWGVLGTCFRCWIKQLRMPHCWGTFLAVLAGPSVVSLDDFDSRKYLVYLAEHRMGARNCLVRSIQVSHHSQCDREVRVVEVCRSGLGEGR